MLGDHLFPLTCRFWRLDPNATSWDPDFGEAAGPKRYTIWADNIPCQRTVSRGPRRVPGEGGEVVEFTGTERQQLSVRIADLPGRPDEGDVVTVDDEHYTVIAVAKDAPWRGEWLLYLLDLGDPPEGFRVTGSGSAEAGR